MKNEVIEPDVALPSLTLIRDRYRARLQSIAGRLRAAATAIERGEIPEDYGIRLSEYVDDIDVCADALRAIAGSGMRDHSSGGSGSTRPVESKPSARAA